MKSPLPIRRAPRNGQSLDEWLSNESQRCPAFRASGLGGAERPYVLSGAEARKLVYDRQRASRAGHGLLHETQTDRRMIPEIYRAFDTHVRTGEQVERLLPTIQSHLDAWITRQQLDFHAACRELAFELGWRSQLGEAPPKDHSAALIFDFAYQPGMREAGPAYTRLTTRIGQSIERAAQSADPLPRDAFVTHYLDEEAAGRLTREGMIHALLHGLGTTTALVKAFSVLLVELSRSFDATAAGDWRRALLDDPVALQTLVTEVFNITPPAPTTTVSLDSRVDGRCPVHAAGVDLPHGAQIKFSVYAENHRAQFDPQRWADDPRDERHTSATFGGAPFDDGAKDPETGLPRTIYCPAKDLMHGFARAFAREVLRSLTWDIQALPDWPPPPQPLVTAYPEGLWGTAGSMANSVPRPHAPSRHTRHRLEPGSRVIVVGGGIGGLVAARELQERGCKVIVLEAAKAIGAGKCESLSIDGRIYNVGAHIVRPDGPVGALADELGIEIDAYEGRHQKFDQSSGMQTHRDGLELRQAGSLVHDRLAEADTDAHGFVGLAALGASVSNWREQAPGFVDFVYPFYYGAGYGAAGEVSTAYFMRFAEASQHSLQHMGSTGTPRGGFGPFLQRLAEDLDVRCGARVRELERSTQGVVAHLEDGSSVDGDHVYIACNRPCAILRDDPDETALLEQVRYLPYITGIIRAQGLNKEGFCVQQAPERASPIASYSYYHHDTDVLVWWGYAAAGQDDDAYLEHALAELRAMGASFPAGEEPIFFQRWDYMPHVSPGDFAAGFYDKLELRQGLNRTWFGGGLTAFELTDSITAWTRDFIDRVCRAPEHPASEPTAASSFAETPLPKSREDQEGVERWFAAIASAFPTILHGFRHHAQATPNQEMVVSLEKQRRVWTFATMWKEAHDVAAHLERSGLVRGDRAVLAYAPDSVHFPAAFYGCLLAGVIAVPVAPPAPLQQDREGFSRFNRIVADCEARAVLTDSRYTTLANIDRSAQVARKILTLGQSKTAAWPSGLRWIQTDKARSVPLQPRELPRPQDIAYVQYTSGSTQAPRGVVITHGMVTHNAIMSSRDCRVFPPQRGLCWLPWWHDLMLVVGFCVPCVIGTTIVYFSAGRWLSDPTFWFEACVQEGISNTSAPNFALELMVKRADVARLAGADLSKLVIYSGGEPVRHESVTRFAQHFGPLGFRIWNLRNIFGMAECTLYISGGCEGDSRHTAFDRDSLRDGLRAVEVPPDSPGAQMLIACGRALSTRSETSQIVVDRESGEVVPKGVVGELWVSGPSVATRHIRSSDEDRTKFGVSTERPSSATRFVRTGDLGFIHRDMVYVCGRAKELIIVGGRNILPTDIEVVVSTAHPAIRVGCVAAFGVDDKGSEAVCVVAELRERAYKRKDADASAREVAASITAAVADAVDARCRFICLVAQRSLPKTTSGKLRRLEIQRRFNAGELSLIAPIVELAVEESSSAEASTGAASANDAQLPTAPTGPVSPASARAWIVETLGEVTGLTPSEISGEDNFAQFGIDSVAAVEAVARLRALSGVRLSPSDLFNFPTVDLLTATLSSRSVSRAMKDDPYVVFNDTREHPDAPFAAERTLFCLPPAGGHVFAYVHIAQHMPAYCLVAFENNSAQTRTSMQEMGRKFAEQIRELQPRGPWNLLAYSLGGAYGGLVAEQLEDCNLVLVDALAPNIGAGLSIADDAFDNTASAGRRLAVRSGQLVVEDDDAAASVEAQIAWDLRNLAASEAVTLPPVSVDETSGITTGTHVTLLRGPELEADMNDALLTLLGEYEHLGWEKLRDELPSRVIEGSHFSVVGPALAPNTAREITSELDASPHTLRQLAKR